MGLPYMPFFVDAYMLDAGHLTEQEHGAYLRLLMLAWATPECRLPNDDAWLARRLSRPVETIQSLYRPIIREFFSSDGNWLWQKRQREEWNRARERSKKQSDKAKSRWKKGNDPSRGISHGNAVAMPTTSTDSSLRSESESPLSPSETSPLPGGEPECRDLVIANDRPQKPSPAEIRREFDAEFWPAYPRRVKKAAALKAFTKARERAPLAVIMDGLRARSAVWRKNGTENQFIPHPATWLNDDQWTDDLSTEIHQARDGPGSVMRAHDDLMAQFARMRADDGDESEPRALPFVPH